MEYIKDWALTLCLCSIGSALIYYLAPKGSMEKPLRTIISMFLLAAVISPLINTGDINFKDFISDFGNGEAEAEVERIAEDVNGSVISSFENLIAKSVEELLLKADYQALSVKVYAVSDENGYIEAERIEIHFSSLSPAGQSAVAELIQRDTGITPEIIIDGGLLYE